MNADPLARSYRWFEYAVFGHQLEHCRNRYLQRLRDCRTVLLIGEGDGRFLARLLAVNQCCRVDVVEASAQMRRMAAERVGEADRERVHFAEDFAGPYDAVVTHFVLDCFDNAGAHDFVPRVAHALRPGGVWILSEFHVPGEGWQRLHAAASIAIMYAFFRLATDLRVTRIPDYASLLVAEGLHLRARTSWRWGLVAAELWASEATPSSYRAPASPPPPPRA